jgi:hypothetical protein
MIGGLVPNRGWKRAFDEPFPLPRGRELVTLEEAGTYITKLPKAGHEAPEWQAAMEALILVATKGGPTMLARIGAEEMDRLRRGRRKMDLAHAVASVEVLKNRMLASPRRLLVR